MAKVTGLSGNEIYCLALKQYSAGELVVGNSVNSMGFLGSLGAGVGNVLGGEVPQVTQAIHEGRASALTRMTREAAQHGASGVAGVTGELRSFSGSTEFLFVGSCVHGKRPSTGCSRAPATRKSSIATWTLVMSRSSTRSATSPIPWAWAGGCWAR